MSEHLLHLASQTTQEGVATSNFQGLVNTLLALTNKHRCHCRVAPLKLCPKPCHTTANIITYLNRPTEALPTPTTCHRFSNLRPPHPCRARPFDRLSTEGATAALCCPAYSLPLQYCLVAGILAAILHLTDTTAKPSPM
eukprot:GHRR01014194.1.p2 GENE.GHRR01014194.1~~GHRR01014194.1.p2  ORF type:complete len:139 (+),score=12.00 GHRR01014194.1:2249-2665(+)